MIEDVPDSEEARKEERAYIIGIAWRIGVLLLLAIGVAFGVSFLDGCKGALL